MPHLLLIAPAGSYRVADHLTAAHELACDVTVVTDAAVAITGSALTVPFTDPERAARTVLAACDRPVDAVVGTDGAAVTVAGAVARRCGLPTNSAEALAAADDKLAQRRALARAGVPQPDFAVDDQTGAVDEGSIAHLLPAVVKPIDRTASQGVVRADTLTQARTAISGVRRLVGPAAPVLVEQFVSGIEVAVDGLLRDGQLQVLAVFDKPDTPTGPTFPETLLISPARLNAGVRDAVVDVVRRATAAIGLTEGPVHAECKVDGDRVWFLELAARTIGGLCSRSLRIAGMSVEQVVVRHALDHPLPPAPPADDRPQRATGVLMLPVPAAGRLVAIHGVEAVRATLGVTDVVITIGPGAHVVPLPDGDRYLGFVFAHAATADDCEQALRRAWAELDVEITGDGQRLVGG
ncbi:ATP-grasp domain-containing protein [soil metagenome]